MWWAIGLATLLVLGLWLLTDQTIRSTMEASARNSVDVDLAGLVDIYASGGQDELARRISDRLDLTPADERKPHYLLTDCGESRIAGDIAQWPGLDPSVSESGTITIGRNTSAFARTARLAPDLCLVVARESGHTGQFAGRIALVFLIGGATFIVLIAAFGRMAALRLQRRIGRINAAFREPGESSLGILRERPGDDEIDELASHSAASIARIQRLMEAYRDTSDQVAHEIRTPLAHLDARLVKALASDPGPQVRDALVSAREEIRRLVGTLESLLDIAASKSREGQTQGLRTVDLSELVVRIAELYADSAEDSGHHFSWKVAPSVELQGEEESLSRLVTNLLDNAFKYVPSGCSIELVLEPGPVLVVRDNGPGIAPEDRKRVFDRFFRGREGGEQHPGAGLGLALAQAIAQRHGLSIALDDSDEGASFRIQRA